MAGLTSAGFAPKTLEEVRKELGDAMRASFGASINTAPESNIGKLIGVMADRIAELWEVAEGVYTAFTPDGATGAALDELAGLTGTVRRTASKSTVTITATGTPGTVIPTGSVVSVEDTGARFQTLASATIAGGGTVSIACEALYTGPTRADAHTVTAIETPVSGWTSVDNPTDGVLGAYDESDAALRMRREEELRARGKGSAGAISAAVNAVPDTTAVVVFENTTGDEVDGVPAHAIEVVVDGGDDVAIAQAIFETKAAGIQAYGTSSETVTDSEGVAHSIGFSRPEDVEVYIDVTLKVDASVFPDDGATQAEQALADWGDANLTMGRDVAASAFYPVLFTIPGVRDVTQLNIGLAVDPPDNETISVTPRGIAKIDTGRIAVHVLNLAQF